MNPEYIAKIVEDVATRLENENKKIRAALYKQNVLLSKANKAQEEIIKKLETIIAYYERQTGIKRVDIKLEEI